MEGFQQSRVLNERSLGASKQQRVLSVTSAGRPKEIGPCLSLANASLARYRELITPHPLLNGRVIQSVPGDPSSVNSHELEPVKAQLYGGE